MQCACILFYYGSSFFTLPFKNGCVLFLLRSSYTGACNVPVFCFSMVLILPAQPQDPVFYSFLIQAHSHAPVYCFSMVLLSYTGEYRLCSVSLKFFPSTMLSNVSSKCMNQFWSNLVTMTNDLARRCPKTLDPVKGHSRSQGSNINISLKTFQLN